MSARTRILLVDDEPIVRDSLSAWLEEEGFAVWAAESGEQALELFEQARPDVAVLDIKMPGMDGLTLLKRLRELDDRLPVVMMTAHATVESAVRSMRDGAYDYVMKPFPPEKLTNLIRHIVTHQQLAMEYDRLHADWEQVRPWLTYSRQLLNLGQAFEAFVSHCGRDLRTAVQSLERMREYLEGVALAPEQRRQLLDCLTAAESEAKASLRAIENAMRCVTEGRPQPQAVSMKEAAEHALTVMRHVPSLSQHQVEVTIPNDLPAVRAEFWSLVQVIQNLLDFAGGYLRGEGTITLQAAATEQMVEVAVSFASEGLAPEIVAALERPPFLGQCPTPGVLSLAVAKIVADRYGGRFEIRSLPKGRMALVVLFDRA